MRGPSRGRDEVPVHVYVVVVLGGFDVGTTGNFDIRSHGGVAAAASPANDSRRRQELRAVANGGDRFGRLAKMLHDLQHSIVEPQVLRSSS